MNEQRPLVGSQVGQWHGALYPASFKDRLAHAMGATEQRLSDLQKLQALIEKNPDIEEFMTLTGKIGVGLGGL